MIEVQPVERDFLLKDGERVEAYGAFLVGNKALIECPGPVLSYLDFDDRLIVLLNWYHASNLFNIYRNIFCYQKSDARLLWQIEQPYDGSRAERPVLEEVFKYIELLIAGENGQWQSLEEAGVQVRRHQVKKGNPIIGKVYSQPFRYGVDRLRTMTLSHFPNEYWVDYETGQLEWIRFHQKI